MAESYEVRNNEAGRRFEVTVGDDVAFAEYRLHDGVVTLPHTVVPPAFEGKGVGSLLARTALDWAREQGLEVIPSCPFIGAYVTRHAQYHDLVHDKAWRDRLGLEA